MPIFVDAEDVLTLPPDAPTAGLADSAPVLTGTPVEGVSDALAQDSLPDLLAEFAPHFAQLFAESGAGARFEDNGAVLDLDFEMDEVLSLADEVPPVQPLPPLTRFDESSFDAPSRTSFDAPSRTSFDALSLRLTSDLPPLPDTGGLEYIGEIVHPPSTLANTLAQSAQADAFALVPAAVPGRFDQASLAQLSELAAPEEAAVETEKHVVFALAEGKYAVPMELVLEVCDFTQCTPVMNVPDWILGVTNLRGDIVSVVDLRRFVADANELTHRPPPRSLVVAQTRQGDLTTCLAVESVLGMAQAPVNEIQTVERVFGDGLSPHTRGIYARGNELLSMLDLESLLRALELTD